MIASAPSSWHRRHRSSVGPGRRLFTAG